MLKMSKIESVSAQGGVSLKKLMAILTVTEDQTKQSADTIGNAQILFRAWYMVTYTIINSFNCGEILSDCYTKLL